MRIPLCLLQKKVGVLDRGREREMGEGGGGRRSFVCACVWMLSLSVFASLFHCDSQITVSNDEDQMNRHVVIHLDSFASILADL